MASVKKHLQNLHPEIGTNLESFWRLEKIETQKLDPAEKVTEKARKLRSTSQSKKEAKEEIKGVTQNEVKEESIKPQDRLLTSQVVNPCYQQLQSDMFPLAYRPPFLYSQQNYELLYMLQAVNQNTAVNQANLWMHKIPEAVSQQVIDPMVLPQNPCRNSADISHCGHDFSSPNSLMTHIKLLPTSPVTAINKRDHPHVHNEFCGDIAIRHEEHIDYLHEAELHYVNSTGSLLQ